jgi:hypothetical protein
LIASLGTTFVVGTSVIGTADADAPPTSDNVNPAAPKAGTAALRIFVEDCFTRAMSRPPQCFV